MAYPKPNKIILPLPRRNRSRQIPPIFVLSFWTAGLALAILAAWSIGFRSGALRETPFPIAAETASPAPASGGAGATLPPANPGGPDPAEVSPTPPAAPTTDPTGGLTLTAQPEHAQFELRHRSSAFQTLASGPVTLRGLPPGEYELTTTCPGFQPSKSEVVVAAGEVRAAPAIHLAPDGPSVVNDPPARPVETAAGAVEFASDPQGVEVWWLGAEPPESRRRVGITPLASASFPAGRHQFEFRLSGSPPRLVESVVQPGETAVVRAAWPTFDVAVTSAPPGARIRVDGLEPLPDGPTVTPVTLHLREGRHDISASYPGLEELTYPIAVGPSPPDPVHLTFRYASLHLTSAPAGADVYCGGKHLGQTPLELTAMPPGLHQFLLRLEGHARTTMNLALRNGERRESHTVLAVNPEPEPGFPFTNGQGLRMVWIPRLRGWAQATEMTQAAYTAIMNENPSDFNDPALPVENVTWTDAFHFCEKLTTAEQGRGYLPQGYEYSLPTDEQWSILAEGSSPDQGVHSLHTVRERTAPAGSLPPSPLGVHDAIGNVWEWCLDWYSPAVLDRALREGAPAEQDKAGARHKILRGGSWNRSLANQLQVSSRRAALPTQHRDYETGFRVVLLPRPG